jgi:hypothetical protein
LQTGEEVCYNTPYHVWTSGLPNYTEMSDETQEYRIGNHCALIAHLKRSWCRV